MKKYHQKKDGPSISHIHVVVPAAQWLKLLLAHIPDKYEHLVRYYGFYSNRSRGERNTEAADTDTTLQLGMRPRPSGRPAPTGPGSSRKSMKSTPWHAPNAVAPCVSWRSGHRRARRHPSDPETPAPLEPVSQTTRPSGPCPTLAARRHHPAHLSPRSRHRLSVGKQPRSCAVRRTAALTIG